MEVCVPTLPDVLRCWRMKSASTISSTAGGVDSSIAIPFTFGRSFPEASLKTSFDPSVRFSLHSFKCSSSKDGQSIAFSTETDEDEDWKRKQRESIREIERLQQEEDDQELKMESEYKSIGQRLQGFPQEDVRSMKILVGNFIRAGEHIEEMISKASENGELSALTLLVIQNRLDLARHDDERDAIQALDLLYRRIESELLMKDANPALLLLNEMLNLNDGSSRQEWLRQCRHTMLKVFPPEDAFTVLGIPGMDLENHTGPIEMPAEDDNLILRIDFIREVDQLLSDLEVQQIMIPINRMDPGSVAIRLRQEEKKRAIELVKDLRRLAATLQW